MKKLMYLGIAGLVAVVAIAQAGSGEHPVRRLLSFHAMYGVDGPFLGATNAINGMAGDDLPWTLEDAHGSLNTAGHLRIKVHGLVFAKDDKVPPELQGTNDEPSFRAILTCLSEDENEALVPAKVVTDPFPADVNGDCVIDAQIALPNPCVAPVVFIVGTDGDAWFAVSGVEFE